MQGEQIKDWKLVEKLGKGGMGEVWAAEQRLLKTRVAIKLLAADVSSDERQVERFFNEANAVGKIKHAGIAKIFDCGFHKGRAYLVMELLEGETLAARIRRANRMSLGQVADIGRQIASVLEATHAAGITHRDLKPDNVFLVPDLELASKERVKILDFGIAKLGESASGMTATGGSMGTPAYMAPEQWNNAAKADARADVYSLGCVLFEMCCGRPPFLAASIGEACTKHLNEVPSRARSLVRKLPADLDDLIARMLEKAPADRPTVADVGAVFGKLAALHPHALDTPLPASGARPAPLPLTPTTLGTAATSLPGRNARQSRGRGRASALLTLLVLGGVGAGGYYYANYYAIDDAELGSQPAAPSVETPLREPTRGIAALAALEDPTPSTVGSASIWLGARDDFAQACKQPRAPVRWCAAASLADGEAQLLGGDTAAAIASFHKAAATDTSWATPYVGLEAAYSSNHDLEHALDAARTAQRLDPKSWLAIAAAARAYATAHELANAIGEYRRALPLAPRNLILLTELALAYHANHQDGEADKIAKEALAIDDTLVPLHLMYAERALGERDGKAALAETDKILAVQPKHPGAHLARGDAYVLLHKRAKALAAYRTALAHRDEALPDARMELVAAAIAKNRLPPPRARTSHVRKHPRSTGQPRSK